MFASYNNVSLEESAIVFFCYKGGIPFFYRYLREF